MPKEPSKFDRSDEVDSKLTAPSLSRSRALARDVQARGGKDAPPSNTASNKCNEPKKFYFKPLRCGVDSLYLSFEGTLVEDVEARLKSLKQAAQSQNLLEVSKAQFQIDDHVFAVRDKGASMFPFVLDDNAFRMQLSRGKKIPMAYIKVASGYLSAHTPQKAVQELDRLLRQFGELQGQPKVSRIDCFVDFVSSVDMESWNRHAWVTHAKSITNHAIDREFSGWSIGLKSVIAARLYDKTLEIESSGKQYLQELWRQCGWNGTDRVWRLEFEFERAIVTQKGLSTFNDVMAHLNGLWSYATTEWLRLTLPSQDDKTRSRWPIHPLWQCLSSIDWDGDGGPLTNRFSNTRAPSDEYLFTHSLSNLTSFMAREGIDDWEEGRKRLMAKEEQFYKDKEIILGASFPDYVKEKVRLKYRLFNTKSNVDPADEEKRKQDELDAAAEQYRRASDGG